jgi:glutaredoxin
METKYKIVNETSYHINTNDKVIEVLERCKANRTRIVIDYGNVETKESWNQVYDISGYIGRSNGSIKVPLLIHNSRSIGGGSLLTNCILSIKESRGKKV